MKVHVVSESIGDETILRVFVDALVGEPTDTHAESVERGRHGLTSLQRAIPTAVRASYYAGARGLVIVADSNGSSLKPPTRMNALWDVVNQTRSGLAPRTTPFSVAIGLAVPSIEAWLRFGEDPQATEASWSDVKSPGSSSPERIRAMKRKIYGTDAPNVPMMLTVGVARARQVAADLPALEAAFPIGFKPLAAELRSWRVDQ